MSDRREPKFWSLGYAAEGDDRMLNAFKGPMTTIKVVRCGKGGCGNTLGEIKGTTEGLLWVAYIARRTELVHRAAFLEDLTEDPKSRCRRHRWREIPAKDVKEWAANPDSEDLFL